MDMIPYSPGTLAERPSFNTITVLPRSPQRGLLPEQAQGVYITFTEDYQFILNKIIGWFRDRDEVELIDHGITDGKGLGYILLEWQESTVDPLFLAILRDEEIVQDYCVYTRDL